MTQSDTEKFAKTNLTTCLNVLGEKYANVLSLKDEILAKTQYIERLTQYLQTAGTFDNEVERVDVESHLLQGAIEVFEGEIIDIYSKALLSSGLAETETQAQEYAKTVYDNIMERMQVDHPERLETLSP